MVSNDQERGLIRIFWAILWTISNKIGDLEEVRSLRSAYIMIKNLSNLISPLGIIVIQGRQHHFESGGDKTQPFLDVIIFLLKR